ncbi:MAG: hypothetical protein WCY88_02875 [Spongiibacteraceae bacterium]
MKNVAILAVLLAVIGNSANAESAVSEAPSMTLALNNSVAVAWFKPSKSINTDVIINQVELDVSETVEKVSIALDKQLEEKIAKELEYAMQ